MDDGDDPNAISSFRAAAGQFASGVTVVTTRNGAHVYGVTATSFVSLSLNPLLVTVSIHQNSPILDEVRESGVFAVSVLEGSQQAVSAYFSTRGRGRSLDRFAEIETESGVTGSPLISKSLSWFDCTLHAVLPGGDHEILVGEVRLVGGSGGSPLLYFSGQYRRIDGIEHSATRLDQFADAMAVQLHLEGMPVDKLIEAQLAVEPAAAALAAAGGASEAEIDRLQEHISRAAALRSDPERFTAQSTMFHSEIGRISQNPAIAAATRALGETRRSVYLRGTYEGTADRATAAHQRILDAIRSRDSTGARRLMTEHLEHIARQL